MRLNVAFASLTQNTRGPARDQTRGFVRALELAEQLQVPRYEIEPLVALAAFEMGAGNYSVAVGLAERVARLAAESGDPLALLVSDRILAQTLHFAAEHGRARNHARRALTNPALAIPIGYSPLQVDRRVSMRIILARIEWLQGFPDRALKTSEEALTHARADGPFAVCQALALAACPIALWRGDNDVANRLVAELLEYSTRYTLGHWHSWGTLFQAVLSLRLTGRQTSDGARGEPDGLRAVGALQLDTIATLAEQADAATIRRAESGSAPWCAAEVLRVKGENGRQSGEMRVADVEAIFRSSLRLARQQNAQAWELRTAISLARIYREQDQSGAARKVLEPVCKRFREGTDTADLQKAIALLTEIMA